ncbi:hormone-sensitive lipase [Dermochelys coriacea]|uniref:hormone-sensitive lipase n=1 Tax=Dermochelys coriacea TaxID=27794 RepID=UPI001CA7E298|nr:hormone-sensitive lipase [Dermochelys coriacea]XP_043358056.1 hormone-sensitive lipase [Dermochelys coriacea]XP_043358057.1 hormone-sensitive lipase [Dermochelys coriacea]XP_043358058.1 hormone-sensitive lipase [Dermochelys coriacea]XP_043358059.1 hormone-sensitive lipase [Dermochelys coriacea]XP_043358060.1 hormone-sensitive lipase [Dermochelys coriacea]XP_043358061.1 hormone-sensitive lipase [Dermochelys coriacea]
MDSRPLFQALHVVAEDNAAFFRQSASEMGRRFVAAFTAIREHARCLEPVLRHFASIYHVFDLDEATQANGYRSLAQTARCCLAHVLHKSRYVAANRRSIFFRTGHNVAELEAYCTALSQLRALLYLAQRLLTHNHPGCLFHHEEHGLTELVLQEYGTLHKGCFYGRCLGFQFAPSIRPFLQTIAISLVSFGENYRRHDSSLSMAAGSLFTSGKFAIDPELRGAEFERITQNLDVHFWKSFWNLTETELLASVASMASTQVRVSRALTVPPEPFELPLAADPSLTVTISPPVAHTGPGPIHMRLISHELREGQDSEALSTLAQAEGPLGLELWRKAAPAPPSPLLLVHFHGGGFVAQTSKSHEPYLRGWAQELGAPVLSVDYALAPEAPFPRALEECFYAYCWALRHCHLLGSTAQRVCLAGDSAGGNLCLTVTMRAAAFGIQLPDGIMAAYPVTLVRAAASPSRLLTLLDPLLPLSVLCKCLSAYAGTEPAEGEPPGLEKLSPVNMVRRDTALLLQDLRLSASAWLGALLDAPGRSDRAGAEAVRKSVSEAALDDDSGVKSRGSRKSQTCQDLSYGVSAPPTPAPAPAPQDSPPSFFLSGGQLEAEPPGDERLQYPDGFEPLRSDQPAASITLEASPVVKNPFMSPLLAPDCMLRGLPPVHIVACALDPMLDDSVMFARRLRELGQPVTLQIVQDLPHGFLSLSQLCRETRQAAALCTRIIREILLPPEPAPPTAPPSPRKHRKLQRTPPSGAATGRESRTTGQATTGLTTPSLKSPTTAPLEPSPGQGGRATVETPNRQEPGSQGGPAGREVGA